MGKGGAQLGKSVKGKSKERRRDRATAAAENSAASAQLTADVAALEQYEELAILAEQQKQRLKQLSNTESSVSAVNFHLVRSLYRTALRADKVESLRRELELLAQNHERDLDRKNELINSLTIDLSNSENQFLSSQRNHMQSLSSLSALHSQKLHTVNREFQRDLKLLKEEFINERGLIHNNHSLQVRELNNIIHSIETAEIDRINDSKQIHETEREEIRNKNLEGINELRINLENKIEDLERQFDDAHRSYVENTDAANEHFKKLKSEDSELALSIFEKKKKILKFQQLIASWRKKIEFHSREGLSRNNSLKQQKELINRHCQELKSKMNLFRQSEIKRLTELTAISRQALKSNQDKLQRAEKILLLAELARKLETEREKVLPFETAQNLADTIKRPTVATDNSTNHIESKEESTTAADTSNNSNNEFTALKSSIGTALTNTGQSVNHWSELDNFYLKYNKVLLDKLAIEAEKQRLIQENNDLKSILQQYLNGIAITDNTVNTENPLLIINGRINLVADDNNNTNNQLNSTGLARTLQRGRPRVTQEAGLIQSNYQMQGLMR